MAAPLLPPAPPAQSVELMLAQTAEGPFDRDGWLFEIKLDGYRVLADVAGDQVQLWSRGKNLLTGAHPALAAALARLKVQALFDGELVATDEQGRPRFELLQQGAPASCFLFDLLALDGRDLRPLPLLERKRRLRGLLQGAPPGVQYLDHLETHGVSMFREVAAMGLEGLVAKREDAPYRGGRSEAWLKICVDRRVDLVVVGFNRTVAGLAALQLAGYREGALTYAGKVGAAMPEGLRAQLAPALESRRTIDPPCRFNPSVPRPKDATLFWCMPELVCEVKYKEITRSGALRQPIFQRLRADKPVRDCALPSPLPILPIHR